MGVTPAFEFTCAAIEENTDLDRLEARGTIRIVLKTAGLEPSHVGPHEMAVVVDRLLPAEMVARGVADAEALCARLSRDLRAMQQVADPNTPDAVFARLAGANVHA